VSLAPAMPLAALLMISMGGLWLEIWRRGWRWWGLAPMLLGALWAWRAPLPDMLVAGDAVTIAIRGDDGLLHFVRKPKDTFAARDWLRRDGDVRDIKDAVGLAGLKCDGVGCVVKKKILIAASLRPEALGEDCARAQVVISAAAVASCKSPAVVIDQKVVGEGWRISLSSPPTAASVRAWRGDRPWAVRRAE
jgi:competence protein ComEC